ncbi:MAG: Hpt domain-containing protein [Deltaproteobacteria bacterium]|nr:Hpt domain-containing protein [Deltaproteobacteria bacterium]
MPRSLSARIRWGLLGACFGVCFPVLAIAIRWAQLGPAAATLAFQSDPLLWIILTAPVFLGTFAMVAGHQHDGLRSLSNSLEEQVAARTRSLSALTDHLTLIQDTIGDALIPIDLRGRVVGKPSARSVEWFDAEPSQDLIRRLAPDDRRFQSTLALGLLQLEEEFLPEEVALAQLPAALERGGRHYHLEYRGLPAVEGRRALLLTVSDVTDRIEADQERARRTEQHTVVAQILRDADGFRAFRAEARELLDLAIDADEARDRGRALHTLKGNAAVFGFGRIAMACQRAEDYLASHGAAVLSLEEQEALRATFQQSFREVEHFLLEDDAIRVARDEVAALLATIRDRASYEQIAQQLQAWSLAPLGPVLERLASHTRRLAARLEKDVEIAILQDNLRVDVGSYGAFFSNLVHVMRNAIDHGLESPEERVARGKPPQGRIQVKVTRGAAGLELEVQDDGRGINWEAIRARAEAQGLPARSPKELMEAMFTDGITTTDRPNDISGRGVGLAALRMACQDLGILLEVHSEPGLGTTFRFSLPPSPELPALTEVPRFDLHPSERGAPRLLD